MHNDLTNLVVGEDKGGEKTAEKAVIMGRNTRKGEQSRIEGSGRGPSLLSHF